MSVIALLQEMTPLNGNVPVIVGAFLAVLGVILLAARLAVTNYFEERKRKFDADIQKKQNEIAIQAERQKQELEIELASKRAMVQRDNEDARIINHAMESLNRFAETIVNQNTVANDERARGSRERLQFLQLYNEQRPVIKKIADDIDVALVKLDLLNQQLSALPKAVDLLTIQTELRTVRDDLAKIQQISSGEETSKTSEITPIQDATAVDAETP